MHHLKQSSKVPLISVGSGIDAVAGVIDIRRPYYGSWTNFRLKNSKIFNYDKLPSVD